MVRLFYNDKFYSSNKLLIQKNSHRIQTRKLRSEIIFRLSYDKNLFFNSDRLVITIEHM